MGGGSNGRLSSNSSANTKNTNCKSRNPAKFQKPQNKKGKADRTPLSLPLFPPLTLSNIQNRSGVTGEGEDGGEPASRRAGAERQNGQRAATHTRERIEPVAYRTWFEFEQRVDPGSDDEEGEGERKQARRRGCHHYHQQQRPPIKNTKKKRQTLEELEAIVQEQLRQHELRQQQQKQQKRTTKTANTNTVADPAALPQSTQPTHAPAPATTINTNSQTHSHHQHQKQPIHRQSPAIHTDNTDNGNTNNDANINTITNTPANTNTNTTTAITITNTPATTTDDDIRHGEFGHQPSQERGLRILIRGLSHSTPSDWIRSSMLNEGFTVRFVRVITDRFDSSRQFNLFEAEIAPKPDRGQSEVLKLRRLDNGGRGSSPADGTDRIVGRGSWFHREHSGYRRIAPSEPHRTQDQHGGLYYAITPTGVAEST
ncbi:GL13186 [Drosophila persimilis]|uniref:GL13186 n=1 Tax=Drosophila persimilis TaxID=7234 RepID=B4HCV0_DROPE|nr:GL13186 [Drosophila persimilis]